MEESEIASDNGNINILPLEMLSEILFFLTNRQAQRAREVCKKWKDSYDASYIVRMDVTNLKWQHLKNCEHDWTTVKLRSFTISPDLQDPPTINFFNHIRKLEFTDWLVSYNLAFILKQCVNLESLSLLSCLMDSPSDPDHIKEFNVENILPPKLNTLKYHPYVEEPGRFHTNDHIVDHLFILLKQVLVNMKLVNFELGYNRKKHSSYYDEIITGLLPVQTDNGNENAVFNDQNSKTIFDFLQEKKTTIKSITLNEKFKAIILTDTNENSDWPPQFEELQFLESYNANAVQNLSGQKHLKRIAIFPYREMWTLFSGVIGIMGNELTEITLSRLSDYIDFDARVFGSCTCLRKLSISEGYAGMRRIINCHLLPPSLRILKTGAVLTYLADQNFGDISFENLNQLEYLDLNSKPLFELDNNEIFAHEMTEDILDHLLKSLSSLVLLKLKLYKTTVCEVQTCTACGHDERVRTVLPLIPADFVRHVKNTYGLRYNLAQQSSVASIAILPSFRMAKLEVIE